ncbi:MAG TPA: GNAT family N-acetyltransferase [Allosphingosinicella sp.]|nr:GNAT family N-acetyltransferase [Allosphingosinicella sp.]
MFEMQPVLTGEGVELRPLREEDWDALYAVASDPLIWALHPASDRWQEPVFRSFFAEAMAGGGAFAIIDPASGRIIGSTRYHGYDPERSEVEIGWTFLARSHWGGAVNREMKRLMLDHAFRFVESVLFFVGPENWRSRRAVEKIGGALDGRTVRSGRESVVYRIRRPSSA